MKFGDGVMIVTLTATPVSSGIAMPKFQFNHPVVKQVASATEAKFVIDNTTRERGEVVTEPSDLLAAADQKIDEIFSKYEDIDRQICVLTDRIERNNSIFDEWAAQLQGQ